MNEQRTAVPPRPMDKTDKRSIIHIEILLAALIEQSQWLL
jgi:hypothetical protein